MITSYHLHHMAYVHSDILFQN